MRRVAEVVGKGEVLFDLGAPPCVVDLLVLQEGAELIEIQGFLHGQGDPLRHFFAIFLLGYEEIDELIAMHWFLEIVQFGLELHLGVLLKDAHEIFTAVYDPEVIADFISLQLRLQSHDFLPVLQVDHPQDRQPLIFIHLKDISGDAEYALGCLFPRNIDFGLLHRVKLHDAREEGRVLPHPIVLDVVVEEQVVPVGFGLQLEREWDFLLEVPEDEIELHPALLLQVEVAAVNVSVGHIEEVGLGLGGKPH